ncbi:MAG: L,D-transpeptidase family protein, partial [Bdellovibrionales bacterium]
VGRGEDPTIYDDRLSQYVIKFQEENGLKPDGVIGRRTIQALNVRLKDRLEQVIVNMERARWISQEMPAKYLVVNIPAQTLWAIEGNDIVHEMPVIIGRATRQTNSFVTKVTGVRFNPTWTVPETIKFEDYLPKLIEDPNYLNDKGVEFYWGSGSEALSLPPESIQWAHLSEDDIDAIRIVQKSGDTNPLGRVRLHMPNQYNIYLHDTSSPGKFHRENRALSSGCVRMLEPEKIANFVLAGKKDWSEEKMREILDEGKMRDIWTQETTPVFLLYQTVWLDSSGNLIYGQDVYSKDKQLMQVLKKYGAVKTVTGKGA